MNNFDLIATLNIDIAQQIADGQSFGNLLIVGPAPVAEAATAAPIAVYASLDEVTKAGFVVTGENADPVGVAARVAFSQKPEPSAIYIAVIQEGETAVKAVERAIATTGWWAVCTAGVEASQYEAIATLIEAHEKVFVYAETDFFAGAKAQAAVTGKYFRTIGIFAKESSAQEADDIPAANRYINVAFAAEWFNYQSGTETTAYKSLVGIKPAQLNADEMAALDAANLNYYVTVGSRDLTVGGKVMYGEWADVIRFRDWLQNDMQVRVVDLFATNSKIPFTDAGIAAIQNQMLASLKAGQDIGGIAEEEFDKDGNTIPGFTTSVPSAASLTAAQKATRKITGLTFKARLASAIHLTELDGTLTYEL